jgi:magnesium transporter
MLGVIDAATLGLDIERELNGKRVDELFQLMGVRVADTTSAGFVARFPSLLWNVAGGLIAAVIAGAHEHLLSAFTTLALFMPVTLALSESIGIQSVVLTIERRTNRLRGSDWRSELRSLGREGGIAALLAVACAALVGVVAVTWQHDARLTAVVALSIPVAMVTTAVIGLLIPRVLHAFRRNPTVAAGPVVLAIADFVSLVVYFRVANLLLR